MKQKKIKTLIFSFFLIFLNTALADPPSRVARLSEFNGSINVAPSGIEKWVYAAKNRPLTTGDSIWTEGNSRAELQLGLARARLGKNTIINIINLDNHVAQFELNQGTLNLHILNIKPKQIYEIDTPNLAFSIIKPGDYRIDVNPKHQITLISIRKGLGEVYGKKHSYLLEPGQSYRFKGKHLADYQILSLQPADRFDRWCQLRNQRIARVVALRYLPDDIIGYEDLDDYGYWHQADSYGIVWTPNRIPHGWSPYQMGHWIWVNPWGWTWVDDAPWGFAPFHYGRWAFYRGDWCWVPGPRSTPAIYSPALVAFVGGENSTLMLSAGRHGIAWFALAPGEIYRPSYKVSQNYFTHINNTTTTINQVTNNITNNYNTTIVYQNQQVPNAITAMPTQDFIKAKSVTKVAEKLSQNQIPQEAIQQTAHLAPDVTSVTGSQKSSHKNYMINQHVIIARHNPPPAPIPFSAQQENLAKNPGRPLHDDEIKKMSMSGQIQQRKIEVVEKTETTIAVPKPPEDNQNQSSTELNNKESADENIKSNLVSIHHSKTKNLENKTQLLKPENSTTNSSVSQSDLATSKQEANKDKSIDIKEQIQEKPSQPNSMTEPKEQISSKQDFTSAPSNKTDDNEKPKAEPTANTSEPPPKETTQTSIATAPDHVEASASNESNQSTAAQDNVTHTEEAQNKIATQDPIEQKENKADEQEPNKDSEPAPQS